MRSNQQDRLPGEQELKGVDTNLVCNAVGIVLQMVFFLVFWLNVTTEAALCDEMKFTVVC